MANQLREWIQGLVTAVGKKAGLTGTINASQLQQTIENMPNTTTLRATIKGLYEGTLTELIIPEGVTTIKKGLFKDDTRITKVVCPSSLKTIGDNAFYISYGSKIQEIVLNEGLEEIGDHGISLSPYILTITHLPNSIKKIKGDGISGLTINNLPTSLTTIEGYSFRSVNGNELTIPNSVVSIKGSAFAQCNIKRIIYACSNDVFEGSNPNYYANFEEIVIPNNWTYLPNSLCYGCVKITTFDFKNITELRGQNHFNGCTLLKQITIPRVLTDIPVGCFNNTGLTTLLVPNNILTIGGGSLTTKNKCTFIFEHLTPPSIQTNTFNTSTINKIYVPKGTSATYKSATNWSNFAAYIYEPNTITFNVDSTLLNNENVLYSIDNAVEQEFTQTSFTGENLSTLTVTSKSADIVIKVGTTQGGSEIGTVANATTTFTFESDTTIYITQG